jgi:AMP-activated protein kinase-like protein
MNPAELNPRVGGRMSPKVRHEFFLHAPDAGSVYLAGSFNGWDPARTLLRKDKHGRWKIEMVLPPGKYQYRFVVDGVWTNDPRSRELATNEFGGSNSVLTIAQPPPVIIAGARRDESGFWEKARGGHIRKPLMHLYRSLVHKMQKPRTEFSRRPDQGK